MPDEEKPFLPVPIVNFPVPRSHLDAIVGQSLARKMLDDTPGLSSADDQLPALTFVALCLKYFRETGSENAEGTDKNVPFGAFGLVVSAVAQEERFGDALRRYAEAMAILRPELTIRFRKTRLSLILSLIPKHGRASSEQGTEFMFLASHCALRWLTGARLQPLRVRAAALKAGHQTSMLRILSCPVAREGTGLTIYYRREDEDIPVRSMKYGGLGAHELPELLKLLGESVQDGTDIEPSGQDKLSVKVVEILRDGDQPEKNIAATLAMSSASLRRRLKEEGTSFRILRDNVRRDLVKALLQTDRSLAAIAEDTGFSDARSFRRACIRWFGTTPAAYRQPEVPITE